MNATKKPRPKKPTEPSSKHSLSGSNAGRTQDITKLNKEAWDTLFETIENPPKPTPALKKLMQI